MKKNKCYTLIIGKGKGTEYNFPLGMLELQVYPTNALTTIHKFAKQIMKHFDIKDGEIQIHSINFIYYKKETKNESQ